MESEHIDAIEGHILDAVEDASLIPHVNMISLKTDGCSKVILELFNSQWRTWRIQGIIPPKAVDRVMGKMNRKKSAF